PRVYQGGREVLGEYRMLENGEVGFRLGAHDANQPVVIDPVLLYSTYIGGSGSDASEAIAVDVSGNIYIGGYTLSAHSCYGSTCTTGVGFPGCPGGSSTYYGYYYTFTYC